MGNGQIRTDVEWLFGSDGKIQGYMDRNGDEQSVPATNAAIASAAAAGMNSRYVPPSGDTTGVLDVAAIRAAITDVGADGVVYLSAGSNYYFDRGVTMLARQRLFANGARLNRVAQATTTTSTTIVANSTTAITVADPSVFRVGQQIGLKNGSTYAPATQQRQNIITSIVGNVVTVSPSFDASMAGTTTVGLAFDLLTVPEGAKVYGLRTNGNKSNWTFARWEATSEVHVVGGNCYVDLDSTDAPGEVLQERYGVLTSSATSVTAGTTTALVVVSATGLAVGDYCSLHGGVGGKSPYLISAISGTTVTFSRAIDTALTGTISVQKTHVGNRYEIRAVDSNGNAVHLSNSLGTEIIPREMRRNNLDTNVGHGDGAITFSNWVYEPKIYGGLIASQAVAAVGSSDSFDNVGLTWHGTVLYDVEYVLEAKCPTSDFTARISIEALKVTRSTYGIVLEQSAGSGASAFPMRHRVAGCEFTAAPLTLNYIDDIDVVDNHFNFEGDTTSTVISFNGCKRSRIAGGSIKGGAYGVAVTDNSRVAFSYIGGGLRCVDQHTGGIADFAATKSGQLIVSDAIVVNNQEYTTQHADYCGIWALANTTVQNCFVDVKAGSNQLPGIAMTGNNSVCQGNTVRQRLSGAKTIRTTGGKTGIIVCNNYERNIADAGTGFSDFATGSQKANNLVLAA